MVDVNNSMDIMKEETFGPVLPIATFDTLDEAIALANDCEFGLTSSVYTTNLNEAFMLPAVCNLVKPISTVKTLKPCKASMQVGKNQALGAQMANMV